MPPKKRAAAKSTAKAGPKKQKLAQKADEELKAKVEELKKDSGKKSTFQVDSYVSLPSVSVYKDYDCMLNQTNINHNNNKYYVIQLLFGRGFHVFTRWGRVGEPGQNATKSFSDEESAIKEYKKKFHDKTKNNWDDREKFNPVPGKYTLIEVEQINEKEMADTFKKLEALDDGNTEIKTAPCSLDKPTQDLINLIFDNNMFEEQMANFELDVKKMPLGKLSKPQIAKGFDVLEEIQAALDLKQPVAKLRELSSKFYTVIPHSFGRKLPPTIDTAETLQKKKDMLLVLGDIELAQSMQKEKVKTSAKKETKEIPHPLDVKYTLLKCGLEHVSPKTEEFKIIDTYVKATGSYRQLLNVWRVDRHSESDRFSAHKDIKNRKLLWHGTNVAVVAAILKSGLRIMPHSGGRVGRGIYFASEHRKSAGYVRATGNGTGIMFLNEVALGKEHHISRDDSSLRKAPDGFDCIIAKGRQEPDPSKDSSLKIDGNKVTVPQGQPVQQQKFSNSSFWQSEYLIYKESQNRIRYLLEFKMY